MGNEPGGALWDLATMRADGTKAGKQHRWILWLGVLLVVIGASLMDVAGRTQLALWWDISGISALVGFLLAGLYLAMTEGWSAFNLRSSARKREPRD